MNKENRNKIISTVGANLAIILVIVLWLNFGLTKNQNVRDNNVMKENFGTDVSDSITLPIDWNDLGPKLLSVGIIDERKLKVLYSNRSGLEKIIEDLLYRTVDQKLVITDENASVVLNLLWAFGLANKNPILERGEIADKRYGGVDRFASTGGWTLATGDLMDHYSKHKFFVLTDKQQELVDKVSRNIYRPCCDNPAHFPDCNHGMAMLGLLELLARDGATESEMYQFALAVNQKWFPDVYQVIDSYFRKQGLAISEVQPKEIVGFNLSSGSGFQKVLSLMENPQPGSGQSCSV